MLAQDVRKPIQKLYSKLNYYQFCEYLGLNPDYSLKYWEMFQQLSDALSAFDDEKLQKIISYGDASQPGAQRTGDTLEEVDIEKVQHAYKRAVEKYEKRSR